ncbi:MAG: glutathione S-transferase family protein [Nannocystaceae bacterium]
MPKLKLTYFDFPGGRGEDCRIALHIANADFEDDRLDGKNWPDRKAHTPFGALPVLEVEGKGQLAQANAILRYVGQAHNLHPTDSWEAARHESIMGAVDDLRAKANNSGQSKDDDEKRQAREEFASGYLHGWGGNVEAFIGEGPFVAGEKLNVVDLKLFVVVRWLVNGGLDYVPATVFEAFSKLMRQFAAVRDHEKVAEWSRRFE